MKRSMITVAALAACTLAFAKLPAPDDAAKAKAAEAAAKTAWQAKVDAFELCKVQDKLAADYKKTSHAGTDVKSADAKPGVAVTAAKPAASAASGTPVADVAPAAAVVVPPCGDPGPFAYNAPAQTPLETSGAHSPAGNATSPPSVKQDSATMAPAKKS